MKKLFLLLCIIQMFGCKQNIDGRDMPKVLEGVIDLNGWSFSEHGPLRLNGYWKFWWKNDPDSSALLNWKYQRHINITPISGGWHNLIVDGEAIGSYGWGVYGLKIKGLAEESLILSIPTVSSAYRVFMKVDDDPNYRQACNSPGYFC